MNQDQPIPTPRTDAAEEARLKYTTQWSDEDKEKAFNDQEFQTEWLKNCPPNGWKIARTLEHSLGDFCSALGFPITVGDNAGTALEKVAGALSKARTLERELWQKEQELAKAQKYETAAIVKRDSLQSERDKLQQEIYAPGVWVCPKCNFTLFQSILHTANGAITANTDSVHEVCPNDMAQMRRVTWKERTEDVAKVCESQVQRAVSAEEERDKLKEALRGLLGQLSNIEVLGEWEAEDINRGMRKTVRQKVDAVIAQCREALNLSKSSEK